MFRGRTLNYEASEEHVAEQVREWSTSCRSHSSCNQRYANVYPTFLVDVGTGSGEIKPRLIETRDWQELGEPFVFLSYAWGRYQFLILRPEIMDEFRNGLSLDRFATIHQDTFRLCRLLGYRYVWIDSLCMIHGSGGGVHLEAGLLEEYVASAEMVLVATNDLNDANEPLIRARKPGCSVSVSAYAGSKESGTHKSFTLHLRDPE